MDREEGTPSNDRRKPGLTLWSTPMSPDFLVRCTACGSEAVWDTEASPPVGVPEIGHPVLWPCDTCHRDQRHIVQGPVIITDKLHHEISVVTEIDRRTVERVMAETYRYRQQTRGTIPEELQVSADQVEDVAGATGLSRELVLQISEAEVAWMRRRGYHAEESRRT
jgi:hypothetical protein